MVPDIADALAEFRRFNYENIYLRPASRQQADAVIALLRALVEHYADRPHAVPDATARAVLPADVPIELVEAGSVEAVRTAVAYVAGMTDRFACERGLVELDWDPRRLPMALR
jgi:dGTPase